MFESYYRPALNTAFSPASAPAEGVSETEHINKGLYAYINAADNPELQKTSDEIFGRTAPFTNSEADATLIGRRVASSTGYRSEPIRYLRDNKLAMPENWSGENAQLYTLIGQNYIAKAQEHYNNAKAAHQKQLADTKQDYIDTMEQLPALLAKSIRSAGGEKGTPLTPEYLEKLTKYGKADGAVESQHRAALAWSNMSAYMDNPELIKTGLGLREKLLDIANILSDNNGNLDPIALAAFSLLSREKAAELQTATPDSTNYLASRLWHDFTSSLAEDQDTDMARGLGRTLFHAEAIKQGMTDEQAAQFAADLYSDKVSTLLSAYREAIDLSKAAPENASFMTKTLADLAGFTGRQVLPMAGSAFGALATRGAGGGKFMQFAGSWAGGAHAAYDSLLSRNYSDAVREGKINPVLYSQIQSLAEAGSEGIANLGTSLKTASSVFNWGATRLAGSRVLTNKWTLGIISTLGAVGVEGTTELLEEELSGMTEASMNSLARACGIQLSPKYYQLGEAVGNMKLHEIAAIYTFAAIFGGGQAAGNFRAARDFASNTDNLLKAGHSASAVRDIQRRILDTNTRLSEIYADPKLSAQQKKAEAFKAEKELYTYQEDMFNKDVLSVPTEQLVKRLQKEGRKTIEINELEFDIQQGLDIEALKEHGIIEAVPADGENYQLTFMEQSRVNKDGSVTPARIVKQQWTRQQLTNWLLMQRDNRIHNHMRSLQSMLTAHAVAQGTTPDAVKHEFVNLRNIPLAPYKHLEAHGQFTIGFFEDAAKVAYNLRMQHEQAGMTPQEAAQQPSLLLPGVSLGQLENLARDAAQRKQDAIGTTEGEAQGITDESVEVSFPAFTIPRADGTSIIAYMSGNTEFHNLVEDMFEADLQSEIYGSGNSAQKRASIVATLKHLESKMPGIKLFKSDKKTYTDLEIKEAYSTLAVADFLYHERYNSSINPAGHRLLRNILRNVETAAFYKNIADAWLTYSNSEEGKAYLESSGKTLMDIMTEAGFRFDSVLQQAKATAQQRQEVIAANNYLPAPAETAAALDQQAKEEQQLADLNTKQAAEPITIPADQSITGKEIVIDPVEEARNESEKHKLIEYYKWAIARDKKNLLQSKRDLKTAKNAQVRIRKALDKNNFRSKEEKDFVVYTLEHKVELESELQEDIVRLEKAIESNEAELEKIDSKEITIEPSSEQETLVSSPDDSPAADLSGAKATTILTHMRDLIAKGKARAEHFAIVFREIPGLTEAQAIEQGIRPLTQRGEPTAAYTQGKLLAERCTDVQYLLLREGKLTQKAKRDILGAPTQTRKNPAWPKIAKKGIAPAEQRLGIIKALQNAVDYAAENPNYNLNFTRHIISKGREYYIATDGRRLAVIERTAPKGSKDIEESLDKNGNVVKDAKFPESWRHVLIALTDKAQTLDLAPFRYLETYPKTAINHVIWQDSKGKLSKYNPNYIGKGIKFFSTLSKAIGSPSTIQVDNQNMGPILMQSGHDGWTAKYLLMPMRLVDGDIYKEGDILLNPQTDPTATFSIRAAQSAADRFKASPLGHNMLYFLRNEARRYARIFGDKTPQEQAINAAQSAAAIIHDVDKYLQRTGTESKPVPQNIRRRLQHLQKIAEKYAQIIATGRTRSFKKLAPQEQAELEAAIAELEAQELAASSTDADQLLTDSDSLTKREAIARQKEHNRAIIRQAAKGRVYATLGAMLDAAADALDTHLKRELLISMERLTAPVRIKRTQSGKLQGKMTAPAYRHLERVLELMALSPRAKEDAVEELFTAHDTLATAVNNGSANLTQGNTLLIELAHQLEQDGTPVTAQTLTAALAAHEARVAIFADITSKNYEQTRTAANAIYHIIRYGRALWQQKHEAREAEIQTYLSHFLANTTPEMGRAGEQIKAAASKAREILNGSVMDKFMNSTQLFTALASYEPLRPLFEHLRYQLSLALDARQKHLNEIRTQELAAFGHIIGIKPETPAGYTDKQLRQISDKFDTFYTENNQTHKTGIIVTWQERNGDGTLDTHTEELEYTNWELIDLLLMYRQEHYQANAQHHGFTPEILTQIENHLGQQMLDVGNAIQQALINDGTIPVYEEREGIPMRHNPFYWPGAVNINTLNTTREEPLVNPYHPAGRYDFLKARVRNLKELKPQNAYAKYRSAIAQRANYIYLDPVTSPLRSLLARDTFANRLHTLIGSGLVKQLKTTINEIDGAGHQETSLQDIGNDRFASALTSATLAALAGNLNSIARQFSAVANAGLMPGISVTDYYKYAILVRDNNTNIGITDVLKLDCFAIRRRDNAYVNELAAMGANAKYSTLLNWTKAGMNLMDKADALANAVSAAIVYNHKYDQLKATGRYTEDQLRARAEAEVSQYLRLVAQPLNRVDKSALYWQLSQHALSRSILYMGSEAINKLGMIRLNYITARNNGTAIPKATAAIIGKMGLTVGLASAGINALIDLLAGNTPDDDDSWTAYLLYQYIWSAAGQYTDAMPVLGNLTNTYLSPYAIFGDSGLNIPGSKTNTRTNKLATMLTDNKDYSPEQWSKATTNFMREISGLAGFFGGAYAPWQWYSTTNSVLSSLTTVANTINNLIPAATTITEWATGEQTKARRTKKRRRLKSEIEKDLESILK